MAKSVWSEGWEGGTEGGAGEGGMEEDGRGEGEMQGGGREDGEMQGGGREDGVGRQVGCGGSTAAILSGGRDTRLFFTCKKYNLYKQLCGLNII